MAAESRRKRRRRRRVNRRVGKQHKEPGMSSSKKWAGQHRRRPALRRARAQTS